MKEYVSSLDQAIQNISINGDCAKKYYPTYKHSVNEIAKIASIVLGEKLIDDACSEIDENIATVFPSTKGTLVTCVKKLSYWKSKIRANFAAMLFGQSFLESHSCDLIRSVYTQFGSYQDPPIGFVATKNKPRQWHPVFGNFKEKRTYSGTSNRHDWIQNIIAEYPDSLSVKINALFTWVHPYCWHIGVSKNSGPKVYFVTDAVGVRELLKFRDVQEGKNRRDALLHWVSEHWRINRFDKDEEIRVRKHLRGMRQATCFGFHCDIEESDFDKREALEALLQRKSNMRCNRRKRRKTVHPDR